MQTERIYRTDRYCRSIDAEVCEVTQKDGCDILVTDRTVFFPEGGGQPSDIGEVTLGDITFAVTYAYDESLEGNVYHLTDAPAGTFCAGDSVCLSIDWDHRFTCMQRHCGEHMLSGAFHNLYGAVNRGFHIGNGYIAIDMDCDGKILTAEEIKAAEDMVNAAIRANYPVDITYYENYEASRHRPVRKDVEHEGRVSIVTIGDMDNPFDCIACCGIHPAGTSEVGLLAVYRAEPNKGMTRIFFDCGRPALEKLRKDYDIAYDVSKKLSSSIEELPHKLELQAEHESELKAQLSTLTAYYKEKETVSARAEIEKQSADGIRVHCFDNEVLNTGDLLKYGFRLAEGLPSGELLVLKDRNSATVLIFSDGKELKCGDIIKHHAADYNGRGGGRPDNARAAFKNMSDVDAFAAALPNICL